MEDVNLLDDIEKDIEGDWNKIQNKIKIKEEEKFVESLIENKTRWDLPNLNQFLEVLSKIAYSRGESPESIVELQILFNRILDNGRHALPKSFEKIWNMFCNPNKYEHHIIKCDRCKTELDVFYEKSLRYSHRYYSIGDVTSFTFKINKFYCFNCGLEYRIDGEEIIGIFK